MAVRFDSGHEFQCRVLLAQRHKPLAHSSCSTIDGHAYYTHHTSLSFASVSLTIAEGERSVA